MSLNNFKGKSIAIDFSIVAYQKFHELLPGYIIFNDDDFFEVNWNDFKYRWKGAIIDFIFQMIKREITPICVLDGAKNELKKNENLKREKQRERSVELYEIAKKNYLDSLGTFVQNDALEKYQNAFRQQVKFDNSMINDIAVILRMLKIPVLESTEEADFLIASLHQEGKIDAVFSSDTDLIVYGIDKLLISYHNQQFEMVDRKHLLDTLEINEEMLVDIAVMLGTDYNDKVADVGPVRALKLIREYGKLELLPSKYYSMKSKRNVVRHRFLEIPSSAELTVRVDNPDFNRDNFFETGEETLKKYRLGKKWQIFF